MSIGTSQAPAEFVDQECAQLNPTDDLPTTVADPGCEDVGKAASRHFLVGLGASAGGLEALSSLIGNLPSNLGTSYVIVQHMSPTHRSMLVQLIARETDMPVSEIQHGSSPEVDQVYITPPNRNVALQDGRFVLTEPAAEAMPKPSVNAFLTSLAEDRGDDAIAVILSGTGSDGALGVRAIKASGGLVFAQEPSSAKYSGMPQAAIDTECVDWTMTPEQIAAEIEVVVRSQGAIALPVKNEQAPATLRTLLHRVMRHARVDFSGYKETTVWRRILRRMVSNRVQTMEDYLALTEKNPEELSQLCKEILISVTSFFRDPKSFESLKAALGELLSTKAPGDEIRVWVAGCATGEEAYSIAIVISELLGQAISDFRVQIFATDIDMNAMTVARRGIYPANGLSEIGPDLLSRYFVFHDGHYEVSKALRDLVVFARQDLAQDPPFLRLDLITCRNVLIYFQSGLQEQVLGTFHYALKPGSLLFLGKSETTHQRESLFEPVARDAKLFRRRAGDARLPMQPTTGGGSQASELRQPLVRSRVQSQEDLLVKAVLDATIPPSVVVSSQLDIRHVFGDVSHFLNIPKGRPDFNLLSLIRPEWRIEAQTLVYQAMQRQAPVTGRLHGGQDAVRLQIRPLSFRLTGTEEALLVSFEAFTGIDERRDDGDFLPGTASQSLEEELNATREHLQTVIEELETSNEEAQALNEELQASNEELQASNEELQASNEELQSTNEELTTVNEELQIKTAELAETNADLENIQNSIGFLILVINDQGRLVRHNQVAAQWLGLGNGGSIGDTLRSLPNIHYYPGILEAAEHVLREQRPFESQISQGGRHFMLRAMPRIMPTRESMGVVITLMEETQLIESQRRLRDNEQRLLAIMNHSMAGVAVKDMSGRYEYVNPRFCELFDLKTEELIGKTDRQIFSEQLANTLRDRDLDALKADRVIEGIERLMLPGGKRDFHALRFPLKGEDGVAYALCVKLAEQGERW